VYLRKCASVKNNIPIKDKGIMGLWAIIPMTACSYAVYVHVFITLLLLLVSI
jgi:hypothetical protein